MSQLRVAPIVEGHGEVAAVRILLDRIWREVFGGEYLDVLQPVRVPRSKLVKVGPKPGRTMPDERELGRAVQLAAAKLTANADETLPTLILVLIDANSDCPKELAPELCRAARKHAGQWNVSCILANPEYETWFVAAAESLTDYLAVPPNMHVPENPEDSRSRKAWVEQRFKGSKYSETVDQPRMTAKMDLRLCRRRSPSLDKLCRELEKRLAPRR